MDTDVIVVGAGPTGLMLAGELALAGAGVLVLDRLAARSGQSKALNLQPRSAEVLDLRGLMRGIRTRAMGELRGSHFAGLPLDYSALDSRHHYQVGIPQARVEAALEERLAEHGVTVRREREVTGLRQDADGVTASLCGPDGQTEVRGRFLVGCDGGRSAVRKLAGIGFPGRDAQFTMVVADVVTDEALRSMSAEPEQAHRRFMEQLAPTGGRFGTVLPLDDGVVRIMFSGPEQVGVDRDAPVSRAEIDAAATHFGQRLTVREVRWASRFSDASRQAERYRQGRVLLAGDAAHIHLPTGGQGLNLGLQDAFNLGWKLAAEVTGRAPEGLLDTYHGERHPVGLGVLENTRIQGALLSPVEDARLVRGLLARLTALPDGNRYLSGLISGLDIRYAMPGGAAHPLLGARMPDIDLPTDADTEVDGAGRFAELMWSGRGLLLDPGSSFAGAAKPWADRVDHRPVRLDRFPELAAILVRPDGYVCWLAEQDTPDTAGLDTALRTWFGTPS